MAQFRFFPLIVDGKSVAEINGYTVDAKANGERQFGAEGILGISDGIETYDIKATSVSPVAGHSVDLLELLRSKKEIGVGFVRNGGFYVAPYKVTEGSDKAESKNGTVTGDFTFMNSGPMEKVA